MNADSTTKLGPLAGYVAPLAELASELDQALTEHHVSLSMSPDGKPHALIHPDYHTPAGSLLARIKEVCAHWPDAPVAAHFGVDRDRVRLLWVEVRPEVGGRTADISLAGIGPCDALGEMLAWLAELGVEVRP